MDKWIEYTVLKRRHTGDWRDGSVCESPCANMKTWFWSQHPHKTNRKTQACLREWLCLCSQSSALKSGTGGSLGLADRQLSPVPVRGPVSREYGRH